MAAFWEWPRRDGGPTHETAPGMYGAIEAIEQLHDTLVHPSSNRSRRSTSDPAPAEHSACVEKA